MNEGLRQRAAGDELLFFVVGWGDEQVLADVAETQRSRRLGS